MNTFKTIVALAGLSLLYGCAAIPESHKLAYEPQPDVAPIEGASEVGLNVVITDNREEKSRISHKKYSYGGFRMASISSEEPIEDVIESSIEQELLARGFSIDSGTSLTIQVDIINLYSNLHLIDTFFTGKAVADSKLSIEVVSENKEVLYKRAISVNPEHKGIMYMSAYNLARPIEMAIEETLDILFNDPSFIEALLYNKA